MSPVERQLAKQTYWDPDTQTLLVETRPWLKPQPGLVAGVLSIPSWDGMMLSSEPIPPYPSDLQIMAWPQYAPIQAWKKWIPPWVWQSCAIFPTHQIRLLHAVGRYPQLLDLLEHAPVLAWQLVASDIQESEWVALFRGKQTDLVDRLGWPGKKKTLHFLRKLRLRYLNQDLEQSVHTCLLDEQRLSALAELPRVNAMALALAARFPQWIGSRLHQSLAHQPCRPMQCQSLLALLSDVSEWIDWVSECPNSEVSALDAQNAVAACRYMVEVEQLYTRWSLGQAMIDSEAQARESIQALGLHRTPQPLTSQAAVWTLSRLQHHAWWVSKAAHPSGQLVAWVDANAQVHAALLAPSEVSASEGSQSGVFYKVRQGKNQLPDASSWSKWTLWLAQQRP